LEEIEELAPQQGLALKSNDIECSLTKDEPLAIIAKGFKKIFHKHPVFTEI